MIPYENASRSPRSANWRGMWPSPARIASSRGKALKLVLAARNSSSAVKPGTGRTGRRRRRPSRATCAMTVCVSGNVDRGGSPKLTARNVIPMNRTASRAAMYRQGRRRVLRLGRLERRHAGRDRLGAGQGDGAGGERPQQQDDRERLEPCPATWPASARAVASPPSPRTMIRNAPTAIISSAETDEQVGRDGEDVAGLAQAAQVADRDQADRADADERRVQSNSTGKADTICSTADDVETATVRT